MSSAVRTIGMMSGTSHDAIDAAAVEIASEGDTLVLRLTGFMSQPYPAELRRAIRSALPPGSASVENICRLDTHIGQAFAEVAGQTIDAHFQGAADLVVSHGQTMFHWVEAGQVQGTLQLGQAAWIAEATGCTVVSFGDGSLTYDEGGALAARGTVDDEHLRRLLADPYYSLPAPKTTGKELFHQQYLECMIGSGDSYALPDLVATLTELTARTVADAVRASDLVVLSGGGTKNPELVRRLRASLPSKQIVTSDELGLPSAAKEAVAFALLGFLTINGIAGTLPSATGARHGSVLGAIVPGKTLPPRTITLAPQRIRIEDTRRE